MDEMKTTVRTLTFSTNYVHPSSFASKSGGGVMGKTAEREEGRAKMEMHEK